MCKFENQLMPTVMLFNRLAVGGYFALAGFSKIGSELKNGLGSFYNGPAYQDLQPSWLPDILAAPYGYALPWAEFIFGVLLIIGLFGRIAAGAIGLMVLSFLIALMAKYGITAEPADSHHPFNHNFILLGVAMLLTSLGSGSLSIDRVWRGRRAAKPAG